MLSRAHDLQVINGIVLPVAIDVVDKLRSKQRSPERICRNEPVFVDVASNIRHRMIWFPEQDISLIRDRPATSPVVVQFA